MVSVSSEEFDHLTEFIGYGNPKGKYWFIGLEEGFSPDSESSAHADLRREIEIRMTWSAVEDIHHTRATVGLTMRGGSPAWNAMSLMALKLDGDHRWRTPVPYKETRLARLYGDTFLTELFPLPTSDHSVARWPYSSPYSQRKDYEETILPRRVKLIQDLLLRHNPQYVFCYGKGDNWKPFKQIFPGSYIQLVDREGHYGGEVEATPRDQAQVCVIGSTTVVFTWHLSGMNYDPLGQLAEGLIQFNSRNT